MEAKGINGQIKIGKGYIEITRKGALGFLTQGLRGSKKIAIKHISSVQFKSCGMFTNGFIQFSFIGGQETKGGFLNATQDENTIMFNKKQQSEFEKLKEEIEKKIYS